MKFQGIKCSSKYKTQAIPVNLRVSLFQEYQVKRFQSSPANFYTLRDIVQTLLHFSVIGSSIVHPRSATQKMDQIDLAVLIVYISFSIPVLYILFRHGIRYSLGWFYLLSFCMLKVVGSALAYHASNSGTSSSGSTIISSIGLSPLLLAASGILHELYVCLRLTSDFSFCIQSTC